ncbi:MAG TPA: NifB/NifX family molybdenum-iron cluster-binding protein [Clostridia bacterium]|nr:NifB/NifX family molybdenum-iron cluster-binding protein [Clostridia bacterium]
MKIAVPVNDNNTKTEICPSFGRTPFYMIKDTVSNAFDFIVNEAAESIGGAGIKAAQLLLDKNVEIVLTPRCGENSAKVLADASVKLYRTQGNSAMENFDLYEKGKLEPLTNIHPGFHGHGG